MFDFNKVWPRVEKHAEEEFLQIKSGKFTYMVDGGHVYASRTKQRIPKSHFKKTLEFVLINSTMPLQKKLRGPSYIFAILMDRRIRQDDW
jgi:hypothetical protein